MSAQPCEYFTRYGNNRVPGSCCERATLLLHDSTTPPIVVCLEHAQFIVSRFPELGAIEQRFVKLDAEWHKR